MPCFPRFEDREARLLSDFFEHAAVALHRQARDGTILWVNRAELDLLGREEDEVVGRPAADFHADPAVAAAIVEKLARGETLDNFEAELRSGDGTLRTVLISANVLWEDGEFVHARCFTRDITKLKRELREADRRKTAILNASLDAIVTMDAAGLLVDFNAAAEGIFGYPRQEAIGRPLANLIIPERYRAAHWAGLERYLRTGEGPVLGHRIELSALHADGHEFPVELSIAVVGGSPPMFTATLRDIGERRQRERELQDTLRALRDSEAHLRQTLEERRQLLESERAARAAAERLSEVKDQFLATLSHELRTPLHVILGWAQILKRRPGSPEDVAKGVDTIERNARAQVQMVDELLDTSRIAAGKIQLELQPLDFAEVVRSAVESIRPIADAKGLTLHASLPEFGPVVHGDPHRLQQVVWNLLSNAVKFTPASGRIAAELDAGPSSLELRITDTGQGMEAGFLAHAFERFRQADASTTRRHGGLGLGLSIVRSLVELHGGQVEARSPGPGQGSSFVVRLPVVTPPGLHPAAGPQADAVQPLDFGGLKVLLVEDDPDARALLQRMLQEHCGEVDTAASAAEALAQVARQRPDAIISDIGMPDVDGFELIRRIRRLPPGQGGRTPAAALTAFVRPQDRQRALEAGFDAHLRKPVEPGELLACLRQLRALGVQRGLAGELATQ